MSHRSAPVHRSMLAAGLALLLVAAASPRIAPAPAELPQTPPVDVTPQVVALTFPVADPDLEVSFVDDFLYLRGGGSRLHAATDVMAPKHRPVHAAVGGTITWAPHDPGHRGWSELGEPPYGWMVSIRGDDGRRYAYVHLNNDTPERGADGRWLDDDRGGIEHAYAPRIVEAIRDRGSATGLRIERGELIGWLGDSGNAKGVAPHLHFEIHVTSDAHGEYRINPFHSLMAAIERGDVPAAEDAPTRTPPEPSPIPYLDVPAGATHTKSILKLTEAGIAFGCTPDRYCPGAPMLRGELAAFLAAAFELDTSASSSRFADVPTGQRFVGEVAAVDTAGLLRGYTNGRFGVHDPLTRAQLATLLVRALQIPATSEPPPFVDVPPGSTHAEAIAAAVDVGLTNGCQDGTRYCGAEAVTRAQIASFLDRGMAWAADRTGTLAEHGTED